MSKVIGSFWRKNSGNLVANGTLEVIAGIELKVSLFKNNRKEKENDPDFNLIISKELEEKKPEKKWDKSNDGL